MFQSGTGDAQPITPLVPTVTARAMRALTLVLRWNLLRYAAAEPAVWSRMSALYAVADRVIASVAEFFSIASTAGGRLSFWRRPAGRACAVSRGRGHVAHAHRAL